MEDFFYQGIDCFYLPHPKLQGNYECWFIDDPDDDKDHFIGRFSTKTECEKVIDKYLKQLYF